MKRLIVTLLTVLLVGGVFAGCKEEGKEGSVTPTGTPQVNVEISVIENANVAFDKELRVEDLILIPDDAKSLITNYVFIGEDGSTKQELDKSIGTHTVTIMLEMADGTVQNIETTYTITGPVMSEAIEKNMATEEWDTVDIERVSVDLNTEDLVFTSTDKISVVGKVQGVDTADYAMLTKLPILNDKVDRDLWSYAILSNDDELKLAELGCSPLRDAIYVTNMIDTEIKAQEEKAASGDEEETARLYELKFIRQYLQDNTTVVTKETGFSMYKTDGTVLPVKCVEVTTNLTDTVGQQFSYVQLFYVDYSENERLIFNLEEDRELTKEFNHGPYDAFNDVELTESVSYSTYEEFKSLVKNKEICPSYKEFCIGYHKEASYKAVERLVDEMVIGDINEILPDDNTVEVENPDATPTPTLAPTVVKQTYAEKYPGLFTWYEKQTKYRRWYYVIDKETEYVGTITMPDGSVLEGEGELDIKDEGGNFDGSGYYDEDGDYHQTTGTGGVIGNNDNDTGSQGNFGGSTGVQDNSSKVQPGNITEKTYTSGVVDWMGQHMNFDFSKDSDIYIDVESSSPGRVVLFCEGTEFHMYTGTVDEIIKVCYPNSTELKLEIPNAEEKRVGIKSESNDKMGCILEYVWIIDKDTKEEVYVPHYAHLLSAQVGFVLFTPELQEDWGLYEKVMSCASMTVN
ncbi:MAG: hypothetical protein IKL53_06610 [Lachnospiraceae bacterium]|nr:hypothetical protein [Lachnospiraceae bacterium]